MLHQSKCTQERERSYIYIIEVEKKKARWWVRENRSERKSGRREGEKRGREEEMYMEREGQIDRDREA